MCACVYFEIIMYLPVCPGGPVGLQLLIVIFLMHTFELHMFEVQVLILQRGKNMNPGDNFVLVVKIPKLTVFKYYLKIGLR